MRPQSSDCCFIRTGTLVMKHIGSWFFLYFSLILPLLSNANIHLHLLGSRYAYSHPYINFQTSINKDKPLTNTDINRVVELDKENTDVRKWDGVQQKSNNLTYPKSFTNEESSRTQSFNGVQPLTSTVQTWLKKKNASNTETVFEVAFQNKKWERPKSSSALKSLLTRGTLSSNNTVEEKQLSASEIHQHFRKYRTILNETVDTYSSDLHRRIVQSSHPRRLDLELKTGHKWLTIVIAIILAILSAIFSGLTLGLMLLDVVQLRILIQSAEKQPNCPIAKRDAKRAKRIYTLRKDGNLLLVTLLIGNVSVNSAFPILASDLTSGLVGFLLSTAIITLFGEVVPQAVCSRYGLAIGYYLCPFVWTVEIILYVIVKPIAMLLDFCLGPDMGVSYNREQLKALVGHHEKEVKLLNEEEARILFGGLDVAAKTVRITMTPLSQVFGIDINKNMDFDTAAQMITSGFSRIPVFDKSLPQCIVGLLYAKDVALIDPSFELPVRSVLSMFGRPVYGVDVDALLLQVLAEFKKGQSHLAVARDVIDDGIHDPYYKHVGIITLEDIIEEILQDEIFDEYEQNQEPTQGHTQQPCHHQISEQHKKKEDTQQPKKRRWRTLRLPCRRQKPEKKKKHEMVSALTIGSSPGREKEPLPLLGNRSGRPLGEEEPQIIVSVPPTDNPTIQEDMATEGPILTQLNVAAFPGADFSTERFYRNSQCLDKEEIEREVSMESIISITSPPMNGVRDGFQLSSPTGNFHVMSSNSTELTLSVPEPAVDKRFRSPTPTAAFDLDHFPRSISRANLGPSRVMLSRLRLFNRHRRLLPLSANEAAAIALFLAATEPAFRAPYLSLTTLQRLLHQCPLKQPEPSVPLFNRGQAADTVIFILQGSVRILTGENQVEQVLGPWHILGVQSLGPPNIPDIIAGVELTGTPTVATLAELDRRLYQWSSSFTYLPDFSAYPVTISDSYNTQDPLRCICISRFLYLQAMRTSVSLELATQQNSSRLKHDSASQILPQPSNSIDSS